MAPIITLTTDFGTQDGFVAQMKGVILQINQSVLLVDVTHDIPPFSVMEGALVIRGLSRYFSPGTIHIGVVDPGVGSHRRGIVLCAGKQFYVGPDNGLFSWLPGQKNSWEIREIQNQEFVSPNPHPTFHGRDVFAPVAAHLSTSRCFSEVGPVVNDPVTLSIPEARKTDAGIEGQVIHIDRFGNLCCNIEARMLTTPVHTVKAGNSAIKGISSFFGQVPKGEPLALINSFGLMEIAVNCGDASRVLGITIGDRVSVRWA